MISWKRLFEAVVVTVVSVAPAAAQGTSSISGTVADSTGGVIPGARVTVTGEAGVTLTAITNANGVFTVPAVAAGTYKVTVTLQGFKTVARWRAQKRQRLSSVQLRKLAFGDRGERSKSARVLAIVQRQGVLALERLDHAAVYYARRKTTSLQRRVGSATRMSAPR